MKNIVLYRCKCNWLTLVTKLNMCSWNQNVLFFHNLKTPALLSSLYTNIKLWGGGQLWINVDEIFVYFFIGTVMLLGNTFHLVDKSDVRIIIYIHYSKGRISSSAISGF